MGRKTYTIRDAADLIGVNNAILLNNAFLGGTMNFPKRAGVLDFSNIDKRNEHIKNQFITGKSYEEIAAEMDLSTKQIRRIINS
jgi:Mor family transcriptional regulator